jgi:hypothetical protein
MATTLITTPGSSGSNSLCSLVEADAYIAASFYNKTAWDATEDSEKESLLIIGGMIFNGFTWLGWPVYTNQAMCWPRWLAMQKPAPGYIGDTAPSYDPDDLVEADAVFPDAIKKAFAYFCYDVLYRSLQNRTSPGAGPATDAIRSISLFGDISLSFSPDLEIPMRDLSSISGLLRTRSPEIWALLSPYVSEMYFISDWDAWQPALLDEVAPSE